MKKAVQLFLPEHSAFPAHRESAEAQGELGAWEGQGHGWTIGRSRGHCRRLPGFNTDTEALVFGGMLLGPITFTVEKHHQSTEQR